MSTTQSRPADRTASLLLLCLSLCITTQVVTSDRVLVLLGEPSLKNSHSIFFSSIRDRGYDLDYKSFANAPQLRDYDQWLYDKIIVMAKGGAELGSQVTVQALVDFVDEGHDLLLAVGSDVTEEMRDLAAELGVDVEPAGMVVRDHFHHDGIKGPSVIAAGKTIDTRAVFDKAITAPIMYEGVGMSVAVESELVLRGLVAHPSAVVKGSAAAGEVLAGEDIVLVALVQARNNARAVVSGSLSLFSNAAFRSPVVTNNMQSAVEAGNEAFWLQVSRWGFEERGVLRAGVLRHRLESTGEQQSIYRVNDHVVVELDIQQRDGASWGAFKADDVQVELVMLDPYVRQALTHDGKGTFATTIHVPDAYGVFKFVVDYRRKGWSTIHIEEQVPIRPYRHNEYERFLLAAYPYYTTGFSMMVGFFVLGFFVLYSK